MLFFNKTDTFTQLNLLSNFQEPPFSLYAIKESLFLPVGVAVVKGQDFLLNK